MKPPAPVEKAGFEPSKSKAQFQREYNDLAALYDRARATRAEHTIAPLVLKMLPSTRARALDIGCGTGQLALHLAEHFETVIGADYSIGMLREAQRLTVRAPGVRLVEMDGERLAFRDGTFDLVVAASLLHHVRPNLAIAEAMRVLRPGGRLLVIEGVREERTRPARGPWRARLVRALHVARQWSRLVRRLGARDALRWLRRWGRHTAGERLLTQREWADLAGGVHGSETGSFRTYAYLLWDKRHADGTPSS